MKQPYQSITREREIEYERDIGEVHNKMVESMRKGAAPMDYSEIEDLQEKYDAPVDDFYTNHQIFVNRLYNKYFIPEE